MSEIILTVEDISKQYRLGLVGARTLKHDLSRWWYKLRGKEDPFLKIGESNDKSVKGDSEYVWALRDINFEVRKGEVLGIIGKNGAGKSTLLKILSRVTSPTTGEIKSNGRIASLLEVGTGFHPEMTGRENIFLNGAILGMTKKEIRAKEKEIIDFSGCERYIDTPVKRYSSGMRVRLAFAVAAHLEPDILVIDEVLAVGDAEFQKKAIGKMQDISQGEGRTVLFVSHNMAAVKSLCERGIVLENGEIAFEGKVDDAVALYLEKNIRNLETVKKWNEEDKDIPFRENIKLLSASVVSEDEYDISCDTFIEFEYLLLENIKNFNLSLVLNTTDNVPVFNSISPVVYLQKGYHKTQLILPKNFLNDSFYSVRILFVHNSNAILDIENILSWEAVENEKRNIDWYGKMIGQIRPSLEWQFE